MVVSPSIIDNPAAAGQNKEQQPFPAQLAIRETTDIQWSGSIMLVPNTPPHAGAVSIIGANRAGIFLSLIPLFSTIMAIFFYNEQFQFFHLIGAILIILGLFLSNKEIKNA